MVDLEIVDFKTVIYNLIPGPVCISSVCSMLLVNVSMVF